MPENEVEKTVELDEKKVREEWAVRKGEVETLTPELSVVRIGGKVYYLREMVIGRQEKLVALIGNIVKEDSEALKDVKIKDVSDLLGVIKRFPKKRLREVLEFVFNKQVDDQWIDNLTNRQIKMLVQEIIKQNQLQGLVDFFYKQFPNLLKIVIK